ncbi:MAG: replicative DNA helicase [Clostridiales bacterium]|nr:replicative DNA helicase [Clostridiales bacterium]
MADDNYNLTADGRELPFSLEAEQAVLGSILLDPSCLSAVTVILRPEHFYLPQHRSIFSTIIALDASKGGKIDALLVLDALRKEGSYDDESGKTYLMQLSKAVPSTANVESYAKIVREKFYVRSLIIASGEITEEAVNSEQSADELLDMAEQKIYDIRRGKNITGPAKISDIISTVYQELYNLSTLDKDEYAGFNTGFSELDKKITGLNRSDLIIVGARPAMGKTSFALNIARNVSVYAKKRVLFFSLEMSKEQLAQRVLSTEARVESTKFRTGKIAPEEWQHIAEASMFLADVELYFDDTSSITVPEMKARARQLKNVDCIVIDYLQLMKSSKRTDNRVQEVSDITRELKMMAKDLNIPVVTCAQLARRTETEKGRSKRPQLSDLRESGSIEQDADIVLMLYRENYYNDSADTPPEEIQIDDAELIIAKNRHGPTGTVPLAWNPDYTLFSTREYRRDEDDDG